MSVWYHHTEAAGQLPSGKCDELLALIRRILHVWQPALGNGIALYVIYFGSRYDWFDKGLKTVT